MAISGVNPKCFILALFVRDDGARFLLGDDPYEFKDKQLHFQQNTIANDVVEVQGNDGYLLAGQVRRPGSQTFDGYVCNGTNSKEEVETKRRAFLQFFRRSHFYKVIYVFPNGTAIQRKQGFLVDDPTVQELYQQYPEYHVALNFEDVNYYTYEEDDQGQEIYAKEAIVKLAGGGATGGLIWDNYGVVWEDPWSDLVSASGTEIQIDNEAGARAPIENLELQGYTYQNGTPTPDAPVVVQTVTGEQTVTVTGKNLCKSLASTKTQNGVTMTKNADGTYTATGTPTGVAFILPQTQQQSDIFPAGTYTFSLSSSQVYRYVVEWYSPSDLSTRIGIFDSQYSSDAHAPHTLTTTEPFCFRISLVFVNGAGQAINYTCGFQIETSSTATTYEPYQSQSYAVGLGSIELCKIGDYQDYIYKSGDDWYVHKETGKQIVDVSAINLRSSYSNVEYAVFSKPNDYGGYDSFGYSYPIISTHAIFKKNPSNWDRASNVGGGYTGASTVQCWIGFAKGTGLDNIKLALSGLTNYYTLATATDTKITDATLVAQLNALGAMKLFIGENNLLVSATGSNLPATLEFSYPTKFAAIGAEWEEGGTKGATIVNVDAIDNTYPVWELMGPATNPTISVLTTNTTLTYNGTITASQKLVIDMFNKTATLNGTSVIGNISGDFVYMAPGTNRVAYTAGNTDAPDSTIYWQEVVG